MQKLKNLALAVLLAPTIAYASEPATKSVHTEPQKQEVRAESKGVKALEDYISEYKNGLKKGKVRNFFSLFDDVVGIDLEHKISGFDVESFKTSKNPVLEYQSKLNDGLSKHGLYLLFMTINKQGQTLVDMPTLGDVYLLKVGKREDELVGNKKIPIYYIDGIAHPDVGLQLPESISHPDAGEILLFENYISRNASELFEKKQKIKSEFESKKEYFESYDFKGLSREEKGLIGNYLIFKEYEEKLKQPKESFVQQYKQELSAILKAHELKHIAEKDEIEILIDDLETRKKYSTLGVLILERTRGHSLDPNHKTASDYILNFFTNFIRNSPEQFRNIEPSKDIEAQLYKLTQSQIGIVAQEMSKSYQNH